MTVSPRPNWTLALGMPLLVVAACTMIVFSPLFLQHEEQLSIAVTLDLTLTAPLLYFFAIRKSSISKLTVIRVFLLGLLIAGLLNHRSPLPHDIKTWISPVIECLLLLTLALRLHKARKNVHELDFLSGTRSVVASLTGSTRVGDILGSEFAVFYYAFAPAGKRRDGSFSYSRSSGAIPVLGVFLLCMLAEGIALHFLIAHWSPTTAWIFTGLSAYTMLQLFAHMRAMYARPIQIVGNLVYLRNGLAADACIRMADIEEINLTSRTSPKEKALKLALLGALENHTVRIKLRQPVTVVRMFGIRREASVILFAVDNPKELLERIS
ncbi:hypothetical protein Q4E93_24785 [Flavitalea sp. BT771]|uniref:hypothetical protein n=1 Tax=Flavitalea sp. BT771 TaxID=3063329 RepID=UPI0026E25B77|nr:hypothetical protein [Flavitalea sp. BT771]MDO6433846.1 hypothetical protein [Flavitalea sp. BT771]MDV6222249.1 hypothetical protein [Flavitalea sp. BT771]